MNTTSIIDRKTLSVSTAGLLGKWYMYWVKLGGKKPAQESLCHFMRVLLIWAPLRWFFLARTESVKLVAPWSVALAAWLDLSFLLAPQSTLHSLFLLAQALMIWAVILVNAVVLIAILGTVLGSSKSKALLAWLKREGLDPLLKVMGTKILIVPVWLYTLVAIIATSWFFLPGIRPMLLTIAIAVVAVVFFIGFLAGFSLVGDKISGAIKARRRNEETTVTVKSPARVAIGEFLALSKNYLAAKKAKICPFIDIQTTA